VLILLVLGAATILYVLRRPDEFLSPYIWDEERDVLARYLEHGWTSQFQPINGELLWGVSVPIVLVAKFGWSLFPTINYLLAVLVFVLTCWVLLVPSSWFGPRWVRSVMVLYLAVIPVNPETYGVMLYTFWWTTLWPVIALGWRGHAVTYRPLVLLLAGLGSLPAAALSWAYVAAALKFRTRTLYLSAAALSAALVAQGIAYATSERVEKASVQTVKTLEATLVYFSSFVLRPVVGSDLQIPAPVEAPAGLAIVSVLALCCRAAFPRGPRRFAALGLLASTATLLPAVPAPLMGLRSSMDLGTSSFPSRGSDSS